MKIHSVLYTNTLSFSNPNMRAVFIRMNGIKSAFVTKEDERVYNVYEGDADTQCGLLAGTFSTQRDAKALANQINAALA